MTMREFTTEDFRELRKAMWHCIIISNNVLLGIVLSLLLSGCRSTGFNVIYSSIITHKAVPEFGGISGCDYDEDMQILYLVSDGKDPELSSMVYPFQLTVLGDGNLQLTPTPGISLRNTDGTRFEQTTDFEGIRIGKGPNLNFWLIAEGDEQKPPGIYSFDAHGTFVASAFVPDSIAQQLRPNRSLEGIGAEPSMGTSVGMG